jgi:hypothetical protein
MRLPNSYAFVFKFNFRNSNFMTLTSIQLLNFRVTSVVNLIGTSALPAVTDNLYIFLNYSQISIPPSRKLNFFISDVILLMLGSVRGKFNRNKFKSSFYANSRIITNFSWLVQLFSMFRINSITKIIFSNWFICKFINPVSRLIFSDVF